MPILTRLEQWTSTGITYDSADPKGFMPCRAMVRASAQSPAQLPDSVQPQTGFAIAQSTGKVKCLALPPRSPNLNAFAERWVRSVKQECLSRLILFGEGSLRRALNEFVEHYHSERNHQGKGNLILFPSTEATQEGFESTVRRRPRLGGLLNHYCRAALIFSP